MDQTDHDSEVSPQSFAFKERILGDFRLHLLSERFSRGYRNGFEVFCKGSDIVDSALSVANRFDIQELYAVYTPHTFAAYLFIKTLESTGVRCFQTNLSPIPWIYSLISGITKEQTVIDLNHDPTENQLDQIQSFIANKRGHYNAAKPYYEKSSRAFKNESALRSIIARTSPRTALHLIIRKILKYRYKNSTQIVNESSPHLTFFLHYQPEANTLPGAGLLVDQINAITKIRMSTPLHYPIFIREHPSTFQKSTTTRYRFRNYYKRLTRLKNVFCVNNNDEPFRLIDRTAIVASISGNVITESICRGKPVIHFNARKFAHFPPEIAIDGNTSASELTKFINNKLAHYSQTSDSSVSQALNKYLTSGINGQMTSPVTPWPKNAGEQLRIAKKAYGVAIQLFHSTGFK